MSRVATIILTLAMVSSAHAQIGGTGRDGPFAPKSDVGLDTGTNGGVFHFTRIEIPDGVTVRIRGPNPAVLLSQADVKIAGRVLLDAGPAFYSTTAGPGGFLGGQGTKYTFSRGGDGQGPGGGRGGVLRSNNGGCESGGAGGHATAGKRDTVFERWCMTPGPANGSHLPFTLRGGSGGGGACGTSHDGNRPYGPWGGGGGGALALLADGAIKVDGRISANGGDSNEARGETMRNHAGGPGAGGAILLRSMQSIVVSSSAHVQAIGGAVLPLYWISRLGGDGRIRFDSYAQLPVVRGKVEPAAMTLELPHLFETIPPRIGKKFGIACAAVPGDVVGVFMAKKGANTPLPPFGTLLLDLTADLVYLGGMIVPGQGHDPIGNLVVPVHDEPALNGLGLHLQSINLLTSSSRPRLSNSVVTQILKD